MVRTKSRLLLDVLEVLSSPYSVLSRIMPQVIAIVVVVFATMYVFMYYQRLDPISALYASIGLVTTIGLYTPPLSAMPAEEKLLLTVLIAGDVAIYTTLIMNIISTITKKTVWIDARARWRAAHVKDHVVVLSNIVEIVDELSKMNVEYILVTNDEKTASLVQGHRAIIGDPTNESTLRSAGVDAASVVIVALDNDNDSLTALIRARRLNPNARFVAMIHNDDLTDVFYDAGATQVVRLRRFIGRALAGLAMSSNLGGLLLESTEESSRALRQTGYGLGFFRVEKGSRCSGLRLRDLPRGIVPILVERNGVFSPYFSMDFVLKDGDGLVILGDPKKFPEIKELCSGGATG